MSTATEEAPAAIDATTNKSDTHIRLEQEMQKLGHPCTAEHDAIFDAGCRMLDAAAIADEPALLAARDDLQRAAFDPARPVSEAFRMALLNSIANLTARAENEQRARDETVKNVAQQALTQPPAQEPPVQAQQQPQEPVGPATATEQARRDAAEQSAGHARG